MNRQNACVVAILALALVAFGQDQEPGRVEVRVVRPEGAITTMEPIEVDLDLEDLDLSSALGSVMLGVEGLAQDADQKSKKQDDGTIVKEIDLGDGRTMKIVISTNKKSGKGLTKTWVGSMQEGMKGEGLKGKKGGDFKVFSGTPHAQVIGPDGMHAFHDFNFDAFGQDVKDHMDRAMRAFDRAREEFIRAYQEGEARDRKPPQPKIERRARIAKPEHGRIVIGKAEAEKDADDDDAAEKAKTEKAQVEKVKKDKADLHAKTVEDIKSKMEEELKRTQAEVEKANARKRGAVQWVDTAPGASTKGEIEALRKEIKELEKMVRDLRDQLQKN